MSARTSGNAFAYNGSNDGQAVALAVTERWWRDRYYAIAEQGYRLRPRYHPQTEPSWFKTDKDDFCTAEDSQATMSRAANRIRDGCPVMLKKVLPDERPHELGINQLFSSGEHSRNSDNHCAPLMDVIELPVHFGSQKLMAFPLLRPFDQPRVQTFGEFVAFFTQICEGIRFMHQLNVAHRGTVKVYTRTQRPPHYYFIDLGLSHRYPSRDEMDEPLPGGDESAPERRGRRLCNPFHTDICYIGNLVQKEFMQKCNGFEFMEDLVALMTQDDPAKRPPIEDVLQEFSRVRASLSKRKLRSAITSKNAPKVLKIILLARQCVHTLRYFVLRRPAIPGSYS